MPVDPTGGNRGEQPQIPPEASSGFLAGFKTNILKPAGHFISSIFRKNSNNPQTSSDSIKDRKIEVISGESEKRSRSAASSITGSQSQKQTELIKGAYEGEGEKITDIKTKNFIQETLKNRQALDDKELSRIKETAKKIVDDKGIENKRKPTEKESNYIDKSSYLKSDLNKSWQEVRDSNLKRDTFFKSLGTSVMAFNKKKGFYKKDLNVFQRGLHKLGAIKDTNYKRQIDEIKFAIKESAKTEVGGYKSMRGAVADLLGEEVEREIYKEIQGK